MTEERYTMQMTAEDLDQRSLLDSGLTTSTTPASAVGNFPLPPATTPATSAPSTPPADKPKS